MRVTVVTDSLVSPLAWYCGRALSEMAVATLIPSECLLESALPNDEMLFFVDATCPSERLLDRRSALWRTGSEDQGRQSLAEKLSLEKTFHMQRDLAHQRSAAGVEYCWWLPPACLPEVHYSRSKSAGWDLSIFGAFGEPAPAITLSPPEPPLVLSGIRFEEAAYRMAESRLTIVPNRAGELRAEVFEALASGTCVFAQAATKGGLDQLFRDGEHLVRYETEEELVDKINFYLSHEETRARIARAGQELVLAEHTYQQRMHRLLQTVERELARTQLSLALPRQGNLDASRRDQSDVPPLATIESSSTTSPEGGAAETPSAVLATASVGEPTPGPSRPLLSLCMIVRDSARTLGPCLASARPWVDEMIVVDTGSCDDTPSIARQYGAHVFRYRWCDDFSAARNESLRYARGDWLFWMDSDDTISPENGRRLRELILRGAPPRVLGYIMQVHCPGRAHEGTSDITAVDHIKVFRNHPELRFEGRIHEQILSSIRRLNGELVWTDLYVNHSGADVTPDGERRKIARDLRILHAELAERPNHPFTLFNLGMTYAEKGDRAEAVAYLRRSLDAASPAESHVRKAYAIMASAYSLDEKWDDAWDACQEGLSFYPDDPELVFRAAMLQHRRGNRSEAIALYERVLAPQNGRYFSSVDRGIFGFKTLGNMAVVYSEMGQVEAAERCWRDVVRQRPDAFSGYAGLVDCLLKLRRADEALEVAASFPAQATSPAGRSLLQSQVFRATERFAEARRALDEALAAEECVPVYEARAEFLFEHGSDQEAFAALTALLDKCPTNAAAYHNLGTLHLRTNRSPDAERCFRASLRLRPAAPMTVLQLGYACQAQGKLNDAIEAWRTVCRRAPGSELAREAHLQLAGCTRSPAA